MQTIARNTRVYVDVYQDADADKPTTVTAEYIGPTEGASALDPQVHLLDCGDGLILRAAITAGRFAAGFFAPKADGTELAAASFAPQPEADPEAVIELPAIGLVYLGPPDVYAREFIASIFGQHAIHISHADPTKEQLEQYAKSDPRAHVTVLVGTVPEANPETFTRLLDTIKASNNALFPGIVGVLPEQIAQAKQRHPFNTLSPIIEAPPLSNAAAV